MKTIVVGMLVAALLGACSPTVPPSVTESPSSSDDGRSPSAGSPSPVATPPLPTLEAETLRIALTAEPDFGQVPLLRAIEALADARGLAVELSIVDDPGAAIRELIIAEHDLAIIPILPAVNAATGGIGIEVIMADVATTDDVLLGAAGVESGDDLDGQAVATDQPGSPSRAVTELCVARSGVDPGAVTFAQVGGPESRRSALLAAQVAGTTIPAVLAAEVLGDPSVTLLSSCGEAIGPLPQSGVVGTHEFLDEHPALVQAFVDAYIEAQRWAARDRDGYLEMAETVAPTLAADVRGDAYDALLGTGRFAVDGGLSPAGIEALVAFGLDANLLQSPVADDWSTLEFVTSYLERHGPD